MRTVLALILSLLIVTPVFGAMYPSDISTSRIFNSVYNSTNGLLKIALTGDVIQPDVQTLKVINYREYCDNVGDGWYVISTDRVVAGGDVEYVITTPSVATGKIWLYLNVAISSDAVITIFEDITATTVSGVKMPIYNKNRSMTSTSSLAVSKDMTITDEGTVIYSASSSPENREKHFGLQAETLYSIRVSTDSLGLVTHDMEFYETPFWD